MRNISKMLADPGTDTLIGMPTYDLLRLRAMPGVEEDLTKLGVGYKVNKSEYFIEIFGYGKVYFRSYDNPARFVAFEVAHTVLDELDTLPLEKAALVWRKASERTRQKCKGRNTLANVTTPDQGINGFTYQKWGKNPQPGYELIKSPTTDNFFLPEWYIPQIRANYDPIMADAYLRGEFVSFNKNKVYHFFSAEKHHTDRRIKDGERLHVGIDFNVGGCCCVVFAIEDNSPVAVAEFVAHDTPDIVNRLKNGYSGHKLTLYPDATGGNESTNASASDIEMLQQAGFVVDAPKANPFIRDRVNAKNALLSHGRFSINTDACPEYTNSLQVQGYKNGKPEKFDTHPAIDDYNDGAGYFIHRKWPIDKPVIFTGIGSAS